MAGSELSLLWLPQDTAWPVFGSTGSVLEVKLLVLQDPPLLPATERKDNTDLPWSCQTVEILPRVRAPPCMSTSRPLCLFVYWGAPNKRMDSKVCGV